MDQSSLLDAMTRETDARCREHLSEAEKQADELVLQASEKCAKRRAELVESARAASAKQVKHEHERALTDAARREDALEGSIAEEIFVEVLDAIEGLTLSEEFPKILRALLDEALHGQSGELEVLAPPKNAEDCVRWLSSRGLDKVKVVADETILDGVAVQDPGRTFRLTNTLSSRCVKLKNTIRQICAEKLKIGER